MRKLIDKMEKRIMTGQRFATATIVMREGSAPRGVGASMLVCEDGSQEATIGGGKVEYLAKLHALELLASGTAADMQTYELGQEDHNAIGMACGGRVEVLFRCYEPDEETISQIRSTARCVREQLGTVLVFPLNGKYAFQWIVMAIGDNYVLDRRLDEGISDALHDTETKVASSGGVDYYIETLDRVPRALVFGGGHVSRALVPLLVSIDFDVTLYENRLGFTANEAFSMAKRLICEPYDEIDRHLRVWRGDYVIVMTHGHEADYEVLCQVLDKGAAYVGCIGSKRKNAFVRGKLLEAGFSKETVDAIHSPIGLAIGAETPQEIAVSIAAELIACRAQAD